MIEDIKTHITDLFREADFETLYLDNSAESSFRYCFDALVKRDNKIFLVKVFKNIDNLNDSVMEGIKNLSLLLNSKPILVGIKNRYQKLDENTIYIRNELPFISLQTLKNILKTKKFPHILARRGGGVVFLDGELVKKLREDKNISRKDLSEQIEVAKRTVCSYENETMRPSEEMADKILNILKDESIYRKINLFEWQVKVSFAEKEHMRGQDLTDFESHLKDVFDDIGMNTFWYKKGLTPFEFSISSQNYVLDSDKTFYPLFSGLSEQNDKVSKMNLKRLIDFAQAVHKNAIFIVNNEFKVPDIFKRVKIPILKMKNLEKIDNEDEFKDFFQA